MNVIGSIKFLAAENGVGIHTPARQELGSEVPQVCITRGRARPCPSQKLSAIITLEFMFRQNTSRVLNPPRQVVEH